MAIISSYSGALTIALDSLFGALPGNWADLVDLEGEPVSICPSTSVESALKQAVALSQHPTLKIEHRGSDQTSKGPVALSRTGAAAGVVIQNAHFKQQSQKLASIKWQLSTITKHRRSKRLIALDRSHSLLNRILSICSRRIMKHEKELLDVQWEQTLRQANQVEEEARLKVDIEREAVAEEGIPCEGESQKEDAQNKDEKDERSIAMQSTLNAIRGALAQCKTALSVNVTISDASVTKDGAALDLVGQLNGQLVETSKDLPEWDADTGDVDDDSHFFSGDHDMDSGIEILGLQQLTSSEDINNSSNVEILSLFEGENDVFKGNSEVEYVTELSGSESETKSWADLDSDSDDDFGLQELREKLGCEPVPEKSIKKSKSWAEIDSDEEDDDFSQFQKETLAELAPDFEPNQLKLSVDMNIAVMGNENIESQQTQPVFSLTPSKCRKTLWADMDSEDEDEVLVFALSSEQSVLNPTALDTAIQQTSNICRPKMSIKDKKLECTVYKQAVKQGRFSEPCSCNKHHRFSDDGPYMPVILESILEIDEGETNPLRSVESGKKTEIKDALAHEEGQELNNATEESFSDVETLVDAYGQSYFITLPAFTIKATCNDEYGNEIPILPSQLADHDPYHPCIDYKSADDCFQYNGNYVYNTSRSVAVFESFLNTAKLFPKASVF